MDASVKDSSDSKLPSKKLFAINPGGVLNIYLLGEVVMFLAWTMTRWPPKICSNDKNNNKATRTMDLFIHSFTFVLSLGYY